MDEKLNAQPCTQSARLAGSTNSSHKNSYLVPGTGSWTASVDEGTDVGACGDRLWELEKRMAAALSTDLLGVLNTPSHRATADQESPKVACLKSAILDLQKENKALCWELWRTKRFQEEARRGNDTEMGDPPTHTLEPTISNVPLPTPCDQRQNADIQLDHGTGIPTTKTAARPDKLSARWPTGIRKNGVPSSHSKCVAWLGHKKHADEKSDRLSLVRLALWQLWELADRALTRRKRSSGNRRSELPEEVSEEDESSCFKKEMMSQIDPAISGEVERLKPELSRLSSQEHAQRRCEEQALLLQQKEMQVTRLQRSQAHLTRSFKAQLKLLRKQQTLELKALQLKMQTEHASALACQNAEMEEQLQGAVEELEKRYRNLLRDAINGKLKEVPKLPPVSVLEELENRCGNFLVLKEAPNGKQRDIPKLPTGSVPEELENRYRNLLKDAVNGKQKDVPKIRPVSVPNRRSNEESRTHDTIG